jgi:hypothetical protein
MVGSPRLDPGQRQVGDLGQLGGDESPHQGVVDAQLVVVHAGNHHDLIPSAPASGFRTAVSRQDAHRRC